MVRKASEIKKMRVAGQILAAVAKEVRAAVAVGVSLKTLDTLAHRLIVKAGAEPAFLGYKPYGAVKAYPATICASVNDVIVHGVPTEYKIKDGDVVKLDFGTRYEGWYADAAWTIAVGKISSRTKKLISTTENALLIAIKQVKAGTTIGDIGYAINKYVSRHGFRVVKGLTGHGIGTELHEDPSVYNEGKKGSGMRLEAGMTIAIEPMVSAGAAELFKGDDDSYITADSSMSAHFEHTVLVTKDGCEILTKG